MKRKILNKDIRFFAILTVIAIAVTLACLITGGYVREGYDIKLNSVSKEKIKATRQVENKVATERLRLEAENSIQPMFRKDPQIEVQVSQKLNRYFDEVDRLRKENTPIFTPSSLIDDALETDEEGEYVAPENTASNSEVTSVALVGGAGGSEEDESQKPENTAPPAKVNIPSHEELMKKYIEESYLMEDFSYEEVLYVVEMDTNTYNLFRDNVNATVMSVFEAGVKEEGLAKTLVDMKNEFEKMYQAIEPKIGEAAYEISAAYMLPNFLYDEEATLKLKEERRAEVEPTYYLPGQTIVDEGAIITEEAYAAIESLGLVSKGIGESIVPIVGIIGVTIFVFGFCYVYIYYFFDRLIKNKKEATMLLFLYLVTIIAAKLAASVNVWVFIPVIAFTLLIAVLLDIRLALVLNIGVTVLTMFITNSGMEYLLYFVLIGTISALVAKYANQRNNVFLLSVIVSVSSTLLYIFIALVFEKAFSRDIFLWAIYAFLNGILTVMVVMGSLPLWEALFGVITQIKLLDLTNPDNELLRRLTIEAPGTYHHSLIVANLAETAAYDIGADPNVARVGGYYHDIGKLKYPQYYSENQVGENLHDELDPYSSVAVITSHVSVGLQMADEKKLPKVVRDIIEEHHGNTLIKFFYHKAKTETPEDDIDEADFRYKHPTPSSREAAVVMLADTVEAAVRSMFSKSKSMDEIDDFTRALIKDKLDDGQLINSGLTIKDLDTVAISFMRVFKGMYHERIPYPKMEKKEE